MKHSGACWTAVLSLAISSAAVCQSDLTGPRHAVTQSQLDGDDLPGYWTTYADKLRSGGEAR